MENRVSIGLYRHFKGEYYYVSQIVKDCSNGDVPNVIYFNVCHPEYGTFVRPLDDFVTYTYIKWESNTNGGTELYIVDRPDNVTGQHQRFERVGDLNFQLKSISTQQLVEELRGREDSPLQDVDFYGLSDLVKYRDYVVGIECPATDKTPYGIVTDASFDNLDKAKKFFHNHRYTNRAHLYKRTFIEAK